MTNRDDTADPVAAPTVPVFPLVQFRARLMAMGVDELRDFLVRVHRMRRKLGDTPPAGFETRWYRLVQAAQVAQLAYMAKQVAPPPDPMAGLAEGDALVDGTSP